MSNLDYDIKEKEITNQDYVEWLDNGNIYRGVVDETQEKDDNFLQVVATSKYIKKDDYFKLYQTNWIWTIHKTALKKIECECDRVIHSDFINDRGGVTNAVNCPDCFWDCVS
jgi:hypothetical protein